MKHKDKERYELNEPQVAYGIQPKSLSQLFKKITISSLEKQEDEMRQYSASLTYVERMAYLQELIRIAYADVLSDPTKNLWDKKIYIDKIL